MGLATQGGIIPVIVIGAIGGLLIFMGVAGLIAALVEWLS